MMENLMTTNPFTFKTSFVGDIEIGGGEIKFNLPLKNWFGDGIEQKIVESAIVFWFKDADCKAENKVVEYLGEY